MKIFLLVVGAIVFIAAIVTTVGALLPKHHVATRTAVIQATAEQVFRLVSGPQDWRTDLKSYQVFTENGREFRRETSKNGQSLTFAIVESTPSRRLKTRIADQNLPFGGSWTYQIEPRNDGCELSITEEGDVYNPVFRFVSRFVIGHTRTIDNYLAMIAKAVQSRKPNAL